MTSLSRKAQFALLAAPLLWLLPAILHPMGDPYEALVSFAQPRNVDTVVADGRILRRGGEFTALDYAEVLKAAAESAAALRARANWT